MIELLKAEDGILEMKLTGKLHRGELDEPMRILERSLDEQGKTHLYVEIDDFWGFEASAFADYLPRGLAMVGKLSRFGRVAVVAGQRWIRWWTALESALLPGIAYEVYRPSERDLALAWVKGRRERPHGPALSIIETDSPDVIGFELDGKITAEEAHRAAEYFTEAAERGRPLRLLGRIKRLGGAALQSYVDRDYLRMKLRLFDRLERYAIVGGPAWLAVWVALLDPLLKAEIRHFAQKDEARAWEWLGARPKDERPLAA
jgi:hypothetical protein